MFKKGFTLAEVLITLGIVGVIAAITLPTLIQGTTTAQIGPKLAKAASAFEQANKALLNEYDVDTLLDTDLLTLSDQGMAYGKALSDYLIMTANDYETLTGVSHASISGPPSSVGFSYLAKDGIEYIMYIGDWGATNDGTPAHKQIVGVVWVDINGVTKPNVYATDVFWFHLMNDGSLQPGGGTFLTNNNDYLNWATVCPINGVVAAGVNGAYCTGHIFENNLKVLYR